MNKLAKIGQSWRGFAAILFGLVAWQFVASYGWVDQLLISTPLSVFRALLELLWSADFYSHLIYSLTSLSFGFALAVLVGVPLGLLLGLHHPSYEYGKFYIFGLSGLPLVTFVPLLTLWFGLGIGSKVFMVFLMVVIPIVINLIDAAGQIDQELVGMAKLFGAKQIRLLSTVIIYQLLPSLFSAIKVAVGRAIIGVMLAELAGYGQGLGFLLSSYGSTYQTASLFAVIIIVLALNLFCIAFISQVEKKVLKW